MSHAADQIPKRFVFGGRRNLLFKQFPFFMYWNSWNQSAPSLIQSQLLHSVKTFAHTSSVHGEAQRKNNVSLFICLSHSFVNLRYKTEEVSELWSESQCPLPRCFALGRCFGPFQKKLDLVEWGALNPKRNNLNDFCQDGEPLSFVRVKPLKGLTEDPCNRERANNISER